jgi:uncharacterized protein (DUF1697 family)
MLYSCYTRIMKYVALLRGINVGGNNRVEMAKLRQTFENLGHTNVLTYINSGNVIFDSTQPSTLLVEKIEQSIKDDFGFEVRVVVRSKDQIESVNKALPESWTNNIDMKTDVMFLWDEINSPKILDQFTIKPGIDEVKYIVGTVLWRVDRKHATKSGLYKIVGTPIYKKMTIRNANTLRKLAALLN